MRRLLRWTFNTLAMASLLLCLATAGLWVRRYLAVDKSAAQRGYVADDGIPPPLRNCFVASPRGHLAGSVGWYDRPEPHPRPSWDFEFYHWAGRADTSPHFGFSTYRQIWRGNAYTTKHWAVPHWSLVSAFAVLPAIAVRRQFRAFRRRRRSRLGCCPACGYDLRSSPGRCPECGRGR